MELGVNFGNCFQKVKMEHLKLLFGTVFFLHPMYISDKGKQQLVL